LLHDLPGVEAERVLLVSLGKREEFGDKSFREAVSGAAKAIAGGNARDAAGKRAAIEGARRSPPGRVRGARRPLADGAYRFDAPRVKTSKKDRGVRRVTLLNSGKINDEVKKALRHGHAVAEGMALAKDLGNLPGNVCNPSYLADVARALGREFG